MNYVISICDPRALDTLTGLCAELELPVSVVLHAHGTAVRSMLDILGIESNEKRVVLTIATQEKTRRLIDEQKRRLFIGVPGHGIVVSVPIKSIGGGKTVAFLGGSQQPAKYTPELNYSYELIVAIANEGRTDLVMNAARSAGAPAAPFCTARAPARTRRKNSIPFPSRRKRKSSSSSQRPSRKLASCGRFWKKPARTPRPERSSFPCPPAKSRASACCKKEDSP